MHGCPVKKSFQWIDRELKHQSENLFVHLALLPPGKCKKRGRGHQSKFIFKSGVIKMPLFGKILENKCNLRI